MIEDFDLVQASFLSQYGMRLSKDLKGMKWDEFRALLEGISPDTPLGRVVAIRSEDDKEVLKHFTKDQRRIRNAWRQKRAKKVTEEQMASILEGFKSAFIQMAGGVKN